MPKGITVGNPYSFDSLEAVIERGLTTTESSLRKENRLHSREAAYCPRHAGLQTLPNPSVEIRAASKIYMAMGTIVEDVINDGLFNQFLLLYKQYRMPDIGLNTGGYVDSIIHFAGKVVGIEIKMCGDTLPPEPKPPHKAQALLYSAGLGIPFYLLYQSRSVEDFGHNLKMKSFKLEDDYNTLYGVVRKNAQAFLYTDAGYLAPKPPEFKRANCTYCPHLSACWDYGRFALPTPPMEVIGTLEEKADSLAHHIMQHRPARKMALLKFLSSQGHPAAVKLLQGADWSEL